MERAPKREQDGAKNPEFVEVDGRRVRLDRLLTNYRKLRRGERERNAALRKRREAQQLKPYQAELIKLQRHLEDVGAQMTILFEGRDAAGKGGTIRRVTRYMNVKHYRVVALGKPSEVERTQWYLQRYVQRLPRAGEIVLFDRSWYNRAMVEPVFGFCTEKEYKLFMRGVVGFEKDLVRQGMVLIKLYFSVSKQEQARRFGRRKNDELRSWKLSEVDLQAQEHWDEFTNMKYEMLRRTHTSIAPWTVIRSDDKHAARLNAMRVVLNTVDYRDRNPDIEFAPDPEVVISGAREQELMEAQKLARGKFLI